MGLSTVPQCVIVVFSGHSHFSGDTVKYALKRVTFGSKDCTKELKLECAYFLCKTATLQQIENWVSRPIIA